jgi:hypothetical protein
MWFAAIDRIATRSHWRLLTLTKGGCPTLDLAFQNPAGFGSPGGAFTQCNDWHTYALARLRAARPDVVVVTQDADFGPGGSIYSPSQWKAAMVAVIRSLPVPAGRVVVLGDIPQEPRGGPQCLSLHPTDVRRCSGQNSPYIAVHSTAELHATAETGARYIDVVPWFCSSICTDVIGRYRPYWDEYHVTATYSFALGRVLGDAIDLNSYARTEPAAQPASHGTSPTGSKG